MESTNIIAILLFIVPGVIAQKVSNRMDMPSENKTSDLGELINGILASLPIITISGLILRSEYKYNTLSEIIEKLNDLTFIAWFAGLSLFFALLFGTLIGVYKDQIIKVVNFIRAKFFNRIKIDDKSCWRKAFLDIEGNKKCGKNKSGKDNYGDEDAKYLEVIIDEVPYKGIMGSASLPNEEKEIILHTPKEWSYCPGIENYFNRVKKVYINLEKNIVIKDYDMSDYNEFCKELIKKSKTIV